ncbi:hypothetical protein ACJIZ3_003314 [Penstemon smallii]|uniref:SHSP domain-containing protein n=1 Tax=Penstemon smallii TaxID=265156 RepID=A0ABD3UAW1_9LAMI
MDSLEPGKIKKIVWKRGNTHLNEKYKTDDPNKCRDEGEKVLSTFPSTSTPAQPFAMPLVPIPKTNEWCSNTSIVFTGTACSGVTGPPIGTIDIGVSKSAYYFCIALPGVKKDPGEFSCEVQRDGKVCIRGVTTTGGKTVLKYSRAFEMKFQQQSAPGPFMIFFCLPGPVDPRLFSPSFRSDAIFEGVVAKYE